MLSRASPHSPNMRHLFFVLAMAACASPTHTTSLEGYCNHWREAFETNAVAGRASKVPISIGYGCVDGTAVDPVKSATFVLTDPDGQTVMPDTTLLERGGGGPQRTATLTLGFTP